ncbi:MAG: type II secretion system protein [Planctomycetota bacterium]|jgi:prepilin-type N-terminal cleavage/methylation domain-containing protein
MKHEINKTAVTLVEMLIVVAIISLLVGMVISIGTSIENTARQKGVRNLFAMLETALNEYREYRPDGTDFPTAQPGDPNINSEILYAALSSIPDCRKVLNEMNALLIDNRFANPDPAADGPEIYDPWGTVLYYLYGDGQTFPTLISAGPDRNFLTQDDITNR